MSDPSYEKAKIGVQLGETGVASSRSFLVPSLSATASANWNESTDNTNRYGASLAQTIWDSRLWSDLDQAQANYLKSQLELSQAHNQLAEKLLSAYLNVASKQDDCSGQLKLATVLEFSQYNLSDSLGVRPPLY